MTPPLPIRLYTTYYVDDHAPRRQELDECLRRNLSHPAFERVVLFVDKLEQYAHLASAHVELVQTAGRMPTYNEFLAHASAAGDPFVLIIANTDIHFDDSVDRARELAEHPDEVWCLSRCEGPVETQPLYTEHYQSSDVWMLLMPMMAPGIAETVQLGKLCCESRFLYELSSAGYRLRNVAVDIPCYHCHASQKRNYDPSRDRYVERHKMAYPVLGGAPRPLRTRGDKILIDTAVFSLPHPGAMRLWLLLLNHLAHSELRERLVVLDQHPFARHIEVPQHLRGPVVNPYLPLGYRQVMDEFCRKAGAACLLSTGGLCAQSVPTITCIYDMRECSLYPELEGLASKYFALSAARGAIFFNDVVRRQALEELGREDSPQWRTILPPRVSQCMPASPSDIDRCRSLCGLRRPYLVHIGDRIGMSNCSNAGEVLQAMAAGPDDFDIVFVGGADVFEEGLLPPSLAPQRVKLVRADDQMLAALLSGALACIDAHRAPGLGLSLLDAMACNCPLIIRSSAAIPQLTAEVAIEAPRFTAEALRRCLEAACDPSLRRAVIEAGRRRVNERSWDQATAALVAYLKEILQ